MYKYIIMISIHRKMNLIKRVCKINKRNCISVFVFAIISLTASSLHALGTGFYTTGRAGLTIDSTGKPITYCLGAGFVLDTAVAKDELFNYRLNVGWEDSAEDGFPFFKKRNATRVYASNTFGLGVIRHKYIRLWTGPQLDLGCQFKNISENIIGGYLPVIGIYTMQSTKSAMFFIGVGAVLGININPGNLFTLSLEVGINTAFGFGMYRARNLDILLDSSGSGARIMPMLPSSENTDQAFGRIEGFSRISFIFRVGDTYTLPGI